MGKEMCSARVAGKGLNFPRPRACTRSASVVRNGKHFCGQHDPSAIAARKSDVVKARMEDEARRRQIFIAQQHGPALLAMLKLARPHVWYGSSKHANPGTPPRRAYELLQEIDNLINEAEGKN